METMDRYLIIAAGGSGSRMDNEIPKQYLEIHEKPVIIWTLKAFQAFIKPQNTIIVISAIHQKYWEEILKYYPEFKDCILAIGGPTRFHSIKAGLKFVPNNVLLAIHDAARPLVNSKTIENCIKIAQIKGNAIPVININESVRIKIGNTNKSLSRKNIKIVQTPQIFKSEILKDAYQIPYDELFTDDASVIEENGLDIFLAEGNQENIKITNNTDFNFASFILSHSFPSTERE
jgi:2-C-methyl-D-erythritol 4-phosphate cytidylyltransferase